MRLSALPPIGIESGHTALSGHGKIAAARASALGRLKSRFTTETSIFVGLEWPAVDCDRLHGSPCFSITTQTRFVGERRIEKVFKIIRIVVLDKPVKFVRAAVADQLLAIDEKRCRQHEDMLDVRICRTPFFLKVGMIFRLDYQRVVGRSHGIGKSTRRDR